MILLALRGLALSIRARLATFRLDLELAAGADPDSDPLRRRRARRLMRRSARRGLARSLERALRRAQEPAQPPIFAGGVPLQRARVHECRRALVELADRLRDDREVDPQGVAMASVLLRDGRSPLYYRHASHTLLFLARRARFALDPVDFGAPETELLALARTRGQS